MMRGGQALFLPWDVGAHPLDGAGSADPVSPGGTCEQTQRERGGANRCFCSPKPGLCFNLCLFSIQLTESILIGSRPRSTHHGRFPARAAVPGGGLVPVSCGGTGLCCGTRQWTHGAREKGWLLAEPSVGRANDAALPSRCWKFKYFIMHLL